jgi:two-component system alkaline phosphatase synthesis response regulator PhoP
LPGPKVGKVIKKILLIDDDAIIQQLVKANLVARGYKMLIASDGEQGLKLVESERPDLILLDIKLPGISGLDVLKSLKGNSSLSGIPVIIATASAGLVNAEKSRELGAVGFLIKPFSIDKLVLQLKQVLGE